MCLSFRTQSDPVVPFRVVTGAAIAAIPAGTPFLPVFVDGEIDRDLVERWTRHGNNEGLKVPNHIWAALPLAERVRLVFAPFAIDRWDWHVDRPSGSGREGDEPKTAARMAQPWPTYWREDIPVAVLVPEGTLDEIYGPEPTDDVADIVTDGDILF